MQQEVREVDNRVETLWRVLTWLILLRSDRCLGNDQIKGQASVLLGSHLLRTVQRSPKRIEVSEFKPSPVLFAKNAATLARREAHLHIALHVGTGFPYCMQAILTLLATLQLLHHPRLQHFVLFQLLTAVVHNLEVMVQVRISRYLYPHDLYVVKQVVGELLRRNPLLLQLLRQDFLDQPIAVKDAGIDLPLDQYLGRIVVELPLEDGRKGRARILAAVKVNAQSRIPGEIHQPGVFQIRRQQRQGRQPLLAVNGFKHRGFAIRALIHHQSANVVIARFIRGRWQVVDHVLNELSDLTLLPGVITLIHRDNILNATA
ncbi:hypothetical protein D3C80_792730 [compost metagenome]